MIESLKQAPPATIPTYSSGGETQKSSFSGFSHAQHQSFDLNQKESEAGQLDKKDTLKLVDELNQTSDSLEVSVKFAFNDKLGEVYVNVIDKDSGEVIRQLPSKEALKLKEAMKEYVGSIFDTKG